MFVFRFDGEDLHAEERTKIMAEQRAHWLKQQVKNIKTVCKCMNQFNYC